MLAAENGSASVVESLLNAGADAKTSLPNGETALMTAARTGNPAVVKLLVSHGADVNARESTHKQTALMWAAAEGNAEAVRALVEAGANISTSSEWQQLPASAYNVTGVRAVRPAGKPRSMSALMFATRGGHIEAARVLLDAGANVNERASDGFSILNIAALNAHWQLATFLLEKGADPSVGGNGWTPLHQVARTRTLMEIGQLPPPVSTGTFSSLDFAKALIVRGANVNARMTTSNMNDGYSSRFNRAGATALMVAAVGGDFELMRLLLANGAQPDIVTANRSTLLQAAAGVNMEDGLLPDNAMECVKIALDLGGDVNAANDNGDTALHGAAFRGHNPIVQLLADRGARLDAKNKKGWTPLWTANADYVTVIYQQPQTAALLKELLAAKGLPTDVLSIEETVRRLGRARNAGRYSEVLDRIDTLVKHSNIEVGQSDGIITLRGPISSEEERSQVLALVRGTPDVIKVVDHLQLTAK